MSIYTEQSEKIIEKENRYNFLLKEKKQVSMDSVCLRKTRALAKRRLKATSALQESLKEYRNYAVKTI